VAIDELTYPLPVANRQGPAAGPPPPPVAVVAGPPRTRLITFESSATAGNRGTSASASIRGPALLKSITYGKSGATDTATMALELGKALTAINEVNVPRASSKPYTSLMEMPVTPMAVLAPPYKGFPAFSSEAPLSWGPIPLNVIVLDDFFHLIFAAFNASGGTISFRGVVEVLEGVSLGALANFL